MELDAGLLRRIAARDETALAALYDGYSRQAFAVIVRILGNSSEAEDVLQETFVRVWSRAETYDVLRGSPGAWLIRIARNRAIDRLRARRVRGDVAGPLQREASGETPGQNETATRETPESLLENRTTAGAVRSALATLTPAQRTLIEAAFFEGCTHTELASRFGMPLGTVKTRIRTGLATMRGKLEQAI